MGLIVNVLRTAGSDCSNNGATKRFEEFCLDNVDGPFEPNETCARAVLVQGYRDGTVMVIPTECYGKGHTMFGGNYVTSSDSRFSRAIEEITGNPFYGAVAVHDRVE